MLRKEAARTIAVAIGFERLLFGEKQREGFRQNRETLIGQRAGLREALGGVVIGCEAKVGGF